MKKGGFLFILILFFNACEIRDRYILSTWDEDKDNIISQNEFIALYDYNDYFNEWDKNDDKKITREEFKLATKQYLRKADKTIPVFDEWDLNENGYIDESEFAQILYEVWDDNGNLLIEEEEFQKWAKL